MSKSKRARSASNARLALLRITGPERILSRRGYWGCYAGRTGPRSPPSWNPPAGSRTRCGG
jgi:hypothetical protein